MSATSEPRPEWRVVRWSPWCWTIALVLLSTFLTVQWSYPYCNAPTDREAWQAWGFPLPAQRPSHARFGLTATMPHVFLLDCLLVGLVTFPALRWLLGAVARFRLAARALAILGALLALLTMVGLTSDVWNWEPVWSIGTERQPYLAARPVGFGLPGLECGPSEFWFGPFVPEPPCDH
jgi:hypothetical protein